MRFQNNANGYTKSATAPFLWCLLFGGFYFAAHGLWGHAVLHFIITMLTAGLAWFVYPFIAGRIVRGSYLSRGWVEINSQGRELNQRVLRGY